MPTDCPWWAPPLLAVQFLTRIPVPGTDRLAPHVVQVGLARAVGWFPLVGALIGGVTAIVFVSARLIWPVWVAVLLALAVEAWVTGAFHEDAVADFCDAFGGVRSADDIRQILKDSRIGSYGAVGLGLALALRATLTVALPPTLAATAIIAAATFGRFVIVVAMATIPVAPARDGLAKDIGAHVGAQTVAVALLTTLPGLAMLAWTGAARLLIASAVALAFLWWLRAMLIRRIGGSTGDCLGFAGYIGQLLLLLAASAR